VDLLAIALQDLNRIEPRLVRMIERGDVDPWDIDLVKLCHLYIKEIRKRELRISGNALLTAAVLLKMKSEIFDEKEEKEEIEIKIEAPDIEIIPIYRKVERKVTVFELLSALQDAFELEKSRIRARSFRPEFHFVAIDISRVMEKLFAELPDEVVIEAVGPLTLFALLHLAEKGAIEIEQEEWNGTLRVRKLGGGSIVYSREKDKAGRTGTSS